MDGDAKKAICNALRDSFDDAEFRRFIEDVAPELRHELPARDGLTSLVDEAFELLKRRGRVNALFFETWSKHRPGRTDRITELAVMAGCQPSDDARRAAPADAAPPDESKALEELSPAELSMRAAAFVYFVFILYDARGSPHGALLVSGGFLLGVVLPATLPRGRVAFVATLLAGVGVIVYAKFLESRRPAPAL